MNNLPIIIYRSWICIKISYMCYLYNYYCNNSKINEGGIECFSSNE